MNCPEVSPACMDAILGFGFSPTSFTVAFRYVTASSTKLLQSPAMQVYPLFASNQALKVAGFEGLPAVLYLRHRSRTAFPRTRNGNLTLNSGSQSCKNDFDGMVQNQAEENGIGRVPPSAIDSELIAQPSPQMVDLSPGPLMPISLLPQLELHCIGSTLNKIDLSRSCSVRVAAGTYIITELGSGGFTAFAPKQLPSMV